MISCWSWCGLTCRIWPGEITPSRQIKKREIKVPSNINSKET